jgi:MYXO-CTERM domain-containing protein
LADTGSLDWATPSYVAHIDNSTLNSVSLTLNLAAGDYTIAMGSNAPANDSTRQGYRADFSTSPVPEPGSLAFLALTALATLRRRR